MKVHAFGLVCLIAGVLAAPIEQAQNLQVKPHAGQHAAAAVEHVRDVPTPEDPEFPEDEPVVDVPEGDVDVPEGDEEGDDEVEDGDVPEDEPFVDAPEVEDETEADVPKNEADVPEGGEEGGEEIDIEAFQQLVSQVQQDVQAVEQVMQQNSGNAEALAEALVEPMSRIEQSLSTGVSRLALPIGFLEGLTGSIIGNIGGGLTQPQPLALLSGLITAGHDLLQNLLGDVLGTIGGIVGGLLGGGLFGGGAAAGQLPELLGAILGDIEILLPGAGAVLEALPVPVPIIASSP